jgi:hypothetical protein
MKLHEIWITINLKVEKHIYKLFSIFKFFCIYLKVYYQGYQNSPLSTDPFSLYIVQKKWRVGPAQKWK